ncbi:hypothetical protein DRO54_10085 [Candidatus Bathyarchaeota archaeon]|nr:MAG: hypothetical protein DRO54_10085 [Candidatus Bathyarchaeota archaeon]
MREFYYGFRQAQELKTKQAEELDWRLGKTIEEVKRLLDAAERYYREGNLAACCAAIYWAHAEYYRALGLREAMYALGFTTPAQMWSGTFDVLIDRIRKVYERYGCWRRWNPWFVWH